MKVDVRVLTLSEKPIFEEKHVNPDYNSIVE
jgi:hypothetical protein